MPHIGDGARVSDGEGGSNAGRGQGEGSLRARAALLALEEEALDGFVDVFLGVDAVW